jgi:hypothetical protein
MPGGWWAGSPSSFQLAADIIETSITTQWEAVGRLAVMRTFLNYFLDRDLAEVRAGSTRRQRLRKNCRAGPRIEAA